MQEIKKFLYLPQYFTNYCYRISWCLLQKRNFINRWTDRKSRLLLRYVRLCRLIWKWYRKKIRIRQIILLAIIIECIGHLEQGGKKSIIRWKCVSCSKWYMGSWSRIDQLFRPWRWKLNQNNSILFNIWRLLGKMDGLLK